MYIQELKYSGADKNKTTDVTTDQNTHPLWRGRELQNSWRNVNIKQNYQISARQLLNMHFMIDGFFILKF